MRREEMEKLVEELRNQDKELQAIFERRNKIIEEAKKDGIWNELYEMLFADGEVHFLQNFQKIILKIINERK